MTEDQIPLAADPDERSTLFSPQEPLARSRSPLLSMAWRLILLAIAGSLLGPVVNQLLGGGHAVAIWITAILLTAGWWFAVRFILLETLVRRFWVVWLGLGGVLLLAFGPDPAGRYAAVFLNCGFLLLRTYASFWHLTSRRRASIFALGLLSIGVLLGLTRFPDLNDPSWATGLGLNLAKYSMHSLAIFWVVSLLHLFLRMRLHFMRLKPKLAVSGLFLALVPLVLVIVLGLVATYGLMGGSRASRGRDVLHEWARMVDDGAELGARPFKAMFTCQSVEGEVSADGHSPQWLSGFLSTLADAAPPDTATVGAPALGSSTGESEIAATAGSDRRYWSPVDTTAYFRMGRELWLLRLRGIGSPALQMTGYRIDETTLGDLSQILQADARFDELVLGQNDEFQADAALPDSASGKIAILGRYRAEQQEPENGGIWHKSFGFGGAMMEVLRPSSGRFMVSEVPLLLEVRLADLYGEFFRGENEINQILVIGLAVLALLFLFVQVVAFVLGIRITTGITSAVNVLHQGTRRLAAGDLQTRIDIPNEDEFGDLASSFNEMTAAIERGRQEAITHERLERELATAREIQERLLPDEMPTLSGFEIAGTSVPSRQVGGDYFDFLDQGDGLLGIAIGDVSGKGMPAALLMANLQASLQGQVIHPSSVAGIVERVNDLLVRSTDLHMFVTFFYGVLDRRTGEFTATNAGHNPPLLRRFDGAIEQLGTGGLLLGMLPGQSYRQQTVKLEPGEIVVLYTDGITEAVALDPDAPRTGSPDGALPRSAPDGRPAQADGPVEDDDGDESGENPEDMFGEAALVEVLHANADGSAAQIKEAILAAVARHTAGTPQSDDITLVVLKRQRA